VSLSESLVIIGLWIIPKIQKTPAECGLKDNHLKYLEDHKDILDELSEVKEIIKLEVMPLIKDIERKINK
jgi:hypothetical protein